jgi:hypothetical protein
VVPSHRLRSRLVAFSAVPGSLKRYSRAIRTQRHIPALHHIEHVRRGQVTLSRTSRGQEQPRHTASPNTTASAARIIQTNVC